MNIFFKSFFTIIFLFIVNKHSELLGMLRTNINGNDQRFRAKVLYQFNDEGTKGQMIKYEKPRIECFGLTWIQHTYKRKYNIRPFRLNLYSEKKLEENKFELCGKTKVLLGALSLGSILGGLYGYFKFYKK